MNSKLIKKIRKLVARSKQANGGRRVRYSAFVKESVRNLLHSGMSPGELSALVGITEPTLEHWRQMESPSFERVKISASKSSAASPSLKIVLPGGIFIECPDVSFLSEILQALK